MQEKREFAIGGYFEHYPRLMKGALPDAIMLDVGANTGLSGLPVAALGYRVVGFEPVPFNVRILLGSIAFNGFENNFKVGFLLDSHPKNRQHILTHKNLFERWCMQQLEHSPVK